MIQLLRFLFASSRRLMVLTLAAAVLSGMCNAGLIAMVNAVLNEHAGPREWLIAGFIALVAGRLATNFFAQAMLARFTQQSTALLRRDLVCKIMAVPLSQLERIGAPRLMATLTEDIANVTQALLLIPAFAVNLAILAGGGIYLGLLSPAVLVMMVVFIVVGAVIYRVLIARGFKHLGSARDEEDQLFKHFRALTEGIKELKLHRERRRTYFEDGVKPTTENYAQRNVAAELCFIVAQNWSHLLFFTLVGLILFLLPKVQPVSTHAMTGYIVTTLYLMGPLSGVLGSLSVFSRASVALGKIEELGLTLASARAADEAPVEREAARATTFESLELVDVTHSYHREVDDNHFVLGPINLRFQPGELVFLVGGNGSGKSTLAKLITGLYPPESGEIRVNGQPVTNENRDDHRQLFSAVFVDFHLFDALLGLHDPSLDATAQGYLKQLQLDHKVRIADGCFSTTALSQGQRKRLALLTAYLEDRPFYLFDEWASDQDPVFKDVFYTRLLPELKKRGKAVLVITHDDRYFWVADRVIKLDYGKVLTPTADEEKVLKLSHLDEQEPWAKTSVSG
ncbi:MAG: cyclic peptide export ABC transporter [Opitutae bacterium]|nr:cyclic peptide export ABC transporter [Opitutae bacterium]